MEAPIRHISDTARWAAMFRARENERPDALFRDPLAARLAGERGEEILANMPHAADNSWAWVMRTYLFDRVIRSCVERGVSTVLNLAAGLDTRPYRMDLPATLHWVEVDLPELLAYKEQVLREERPEYPPERIAMDLTDTVARRALFHRLGAGLALSEGLLIYMSPAEVGELATDLATAGMDYWLMDLVSPALLQMLHATTGQGPASAGAPYRFGPAERAAFFEPFGWTPAEVYSIFDAGLETGRLPKELLASPPPGSGPAGDFWSGVCLLRRSGKSL